MTVQDSYAIHNSPTHSESKRGYYITATEAEGMTEGLRFYASSVVQFLVEETLIVAESAVKTHLFEDIPRTLPWRSARAS